MGPTMESKWNQDLEKESPELILDAMKASVQKMLQKNHREVSGVLMWQETMTSLGCHISRSEAGDQIRSWGMDRYLCEP